MGLKEELTEINNDVIDIVNMGFEFTKTQSDYVPNYEDPGLTFENGKTKRAKSIETCVLYVDIRSSTELSKSKSQELMARLYTSFVKSILTIADRHNGVVRNIIGDRVMLVFPENNCFTNAVDAAISINTISSRIINKHFIDIDFKVGIGIDYGKMMVIKAGIPKQEKERTNYKNLVWVGNPANIASKLTDIANKESIEKKYKVTRYPNNPRAWKYGDESNYPASLGFPSIFRDGYNPIRVQHEPLHLNTTETVILTQEEFANTIWQYSPESDITTLYGKMVKFEKIDINKKADPILMTKIVWEEFKKANPARVDVTKPLWKEQNLNIPDYRDKVIGGDVYWKIMNEVNI